MSTRPTAARFTVITLGVADMRRSIAFYDGLGFARRLRGTGDDVAFFDTGGTVLALYPWGRLAREAALDDKPRPLAFRGVTLAWNCNSAADVDAALQFAVAQGATLLKQAEATNYGGYAGYFADPDGHCWEVVAAPGMTVDEGGRLMLPE
jgi:catechol 2,3-dioxygenase-like lactoylglutathione lyase family enzyme